MAGRYVILEFDDREAANAFVANSNLPDQLGFEVKAMYLRPSKFCECPDKQRQNNSNWKKHKRYGLFVCANCGMPSKFHERGILERLQYTFGYSILGRR